MKDVVGTCRRLRMVSFRDPSSAIAVVEDGMFIAFSRSRLTQVVPTVRGSRRLLAYERV